MFDFIFVVWEGSIRSVFDIVADFFLAETRYTGQINRLVTVCQMNRLKELFPINLNDGIERTHPQFTLELMKLENYDN